MQTRSTSESVNETTTTTTDDDDGERAIDRLRGMSTVYGVSLVWLNWLLALSGVEVILMK